MTTPATIYSLPLATGGGVSLSFSATAPSGSATVSRITSGASAVTVLYSGAIINNYLDVGDGLPSPLLPSQSYAYTYSDNYGSAQTPYINPISYLTISQEPITPILIRCIQGAFNSLTLPPGVGLCEVLQAMPLAQIPKLPFVVVNMDLMGQTNIPIGASMWALNAVSGYGPISSGNTYNYPWTITGLVERTFRVSVLANNAQTRDFYRDALGAIFNALFYPVFQPLGLDVSHKWQVTAGQMVDDRKGFSPGFYYAEFILTFEGTLDVTVGQPLGLIETISAYPTESSQITQDAGGLVTVTDQISVTAVGQ